MKLLQRNADKEEKWSFFSLSFTIPSKNGTEQMNSTRVDCVSNAEMIETKAKQMHK